MTIEKQGQGQQLTLILTGRLDTMTAPELEKTFAESLTNITELTLDFKNLTYVSSAGLRVLLGAQKCMNTQGRMSVVHVCDEIMDVFNITGFCEILTIQP
ncbi:MAG: STAS domain-containing protein [Clostridia bacterium]